MRLLVLGGTKFVGRHLAEAALAGGHQVTLFHRGRTNPGLFPEAEHLLGDRGGDLAPLRGRRWDAVLDVNGYLPREVKASTDLLADAVERYVFISTISVYASFKTPGLREDSPLEQPLPEDDEADEVSSDDYGRLKVRCEELVEESFPDRSLIVRPCIIVGPWDHTGRFAYWVERAARGGEVLAPGRPDRPVELIDARDLAAWVLRMTEGRTTGLFNATGPRDVLAMREMLETCRDATGGDAAFTWIPDDFLDEREVKLPFWYPEEKEGYNLTDHSRATSQGLSFRPLEETVRDVHAWVAGDPARQPDKLSPEREAELLREWRGRG
ncbi:MAG TPA: NAD-dependent epimerase/dehydratase family protein [Thermoanaerobaculia bacterium]